MIYPHAVFVLAFRSISFSHFTVGTHTVYIFISYIMQDSNQDDQNVFFPGRA